MPVIKSLIYSMDTSLSIATDITYFAGRKPFAVDYLPYTSEYSDASRDLVEFLVRRNVELDGVKWYFPQRLQLKPADTGRTASVTHFQAG